MRESCGGETQLFLIGSYTPWDLGVGTRARQEFAAQPSCAASMALVLAVLRGLMVHSPRIGSRWPHVSPTRMGVLAGAVAFWLAAAAAELGAVV